MTPSLEDAPDIHLRRRRPRRRQGAVRRMGKGSYTRLKLYFDVLPAVRMGSPGSGGHSNEDNKQTPKISISNPTWKQQRA